MPQIPQRPMVTDQPRLMVSQLRVLQALAGGKSLVKVDLCLACGWSPVSATIRAAINGIPEGSSSGAARKGLIDLGMVERLELDIDGVKEVRWVLTDLGEQAWLDQGRDLPPPRDRNLSVNRRYRSGEQEA